MATTIFDNIKVCLEKRERYLSISKQLPEDNPRDDPNGVPEELLPVNTGKRIFATKLGKSECVFSLSEDGVYRVYASAADLDAGKPMLEGLPSADQFYEDLEFVEQLSNDGPSKTLAFRRMRFLQAQFALYSLTNEQAEKEAQRNVPHRDFYNIRKVDTHIHHSSSMNCKHLLSFIRSKVNACPNDVVTHRDGRDLTLKEVFDSLGLSAYDLSFDSLDTHAQNDTFHRFDRFNLKYNPVGESRLREVFLKTDNKIKGRYLAELTKQLIEEMESSKYQTAEWRLSIYGRSASEWSKLAAWVVDNDLFSDNIRWMIQIPRLYEIYKSSKSVVSFEDYLRNIFEPLFQVTQDPSRDPKLHHFLKRVVGFDTVDDESKAERSMSGVIVPKAWTSDANPPYSYYLYYLYANIAALNAFRKERELNTFTFRPHAGEAGSPSHLAAAFLTSDGINHGILLRKAPVLQYLYYLAQIHISMSPLSNNALFLAYDRNPFLDYFQRGLRVTLSTDDPLQFHYTWEPLIEEYSVAAQIWKLTSADMCEIARNSVLASGFEASIKRQWIGDSYQFPGAMGNDMAKTNVPDKRMEFRHEMLMGEIKLVKGEVDRKKSLSGSLIVETLPHESMEMALEMEGIK